MLSAKKGGIKLASIVKGDPNAPFSIATTPRCMGKRYSFSFELLNFTLDPYLIMLSAKKGGIKLASIVKGDLNAPFSIATTPKVYGKALLLSQNCSTLPLIRTL